MVSGVIYLTSVTGLIIFNFLAGLVRILFDISKLIKFFVLVIVVVADSMFFMPGCCTTQEAMIHMFVMSLPVCYIYKN